MVVGALYAHGLLVAYSRYYLNFHTPAQLVVGWSIGMATGAGWYLLMTRVVYPAGWLDRVCRTRLGRALGLRDVSGIDNILQREYQLYEQARDVLPKKTT